MVINEWITQPNQTAGICGFCAALYALYQTNVRYRQRFQEFSKTSVDKIIYSEVSYYIKQLIEKKEKEELEAQGVLSEIVEFTKLFGEKYFQVKNNNSMEEENELDDVVFWAKILAKKFEDASSCHGDIENLKPLGVAMTPRTILDYLKFAHERLGDPHPKLRLTQRIDQNDRVFNPDVDEAIIGVREDLNSELPSNTRMLEEFHDYQQIAHWIYYCKGNLYQYGSIYKLLSLEDEDFIKYKKADSPSPPDKKEVICTITWSE
ncbi:hypothetical protein [Oxynema aestuarii]|uniref:Uncharacterized protein n=1 Tax=Oxynema aestuarii AP17 TaxID=2064643 RepID=A0A6H1U0U1_9CYAN|nr:hypothetical protein [Oxynema aestuarii]QIZ71633.1 hypothetical protein HCG48_14425 [Oxynema aestuarii AP17]